MKIRFDCDVSIVSINSVVAITSLTMDNFLTDLFYCYVVLILSCQVNLCFARKNVLFLVSDDLRPQLGSYSDKNAPSPIHPPMYTPNLDKLASKSLLLKRASGLCPTGHMRCFEDVIPNRAPARHNARLRFDLLLEKCRRKLYNYSALFQKQWLRFRRYG